MMETTYTRYQSKPVQIKAMHFSGGPECATPIINWILSEEKTPGGARWHEERWFDTIVRPDGIALNSSRREPVAEHITVDLPVGSLFVRAGQWLCFDGDDFFVAEDELFKNEYEKSGSEVAEWEVQ